MFVVNSIAFSHHLLSTACFVYALEEVTIVDPSQINLFFSVIPQNAQAEAMTPEEKETHKNTGSLLPTISPAFAPLIANKNLMAAFEGMGFTDSMSGNTKWSCGFVISKPPRSPSLPWHQDCVVWDHDIAYESRPHQVS